MDNTKNKKCYNCEYASKGFKLGSTTHHQCNHPKHEKGFNSGDLTAWDTLQEFWQTCEDHKFKKNTFKTLHE